jgi:uncharacterized protein (TIGR02217 family)
MTTLVGQDGSSWGSPTNTSTVQNASGDAVASGGLTHYPGTAGTAAVAKINFGSGSGSAGHVKICLYDASGNLVATSAAIALAAGVQSGTISATITAQNYTLVVVPDTGYFPSVVNSGSSNFADKQFTAAHFSYSSPPSTLPSPDVGVGQEIQVWLETAPATSFTLTAATGVYAYTGENAALLPGGASGFMLGQQGTGWTQVLNSLSNPANGDSFYFAAGYISAVTGAMTAAHFAFFNGSSTCNSIEVSVYDSGLNLIATSAPIGHTAGDNSAAISGNLTAGNLYYLVAQVDTGRAAGTGNSGASGFKVNGNAAANFIYGSPPPILPAADYTNQGQEFICYIVGIAAVGPSDFSLVCQPGVYSYLGAPSISDFVAYANPGVYAYSGGSTSSSIGGGGSGTGNQPGDALYPNNILGLTFNVTRTPRYNTARHPSPGGKETRVSLQQYPLIHFELDYELLRDDLAVSDLKALVGLFNSTQGRLGSFLFQDPDFNTVSAQPFGTGTGSTATLFQLVATYKNSSGPGANEIIQNLNGTPQLFDNGTLINPATYTIGPTGIVQFTSSPPIAGHALTWSGGFYYRCAFDDDEIDWTKFMSKWWQAKISFTSVLL